MFSLIEIITGWAYLEDDMLDEGVEEDELEEE